MSAAEAVAKHGLSTKGSSNVHRSTGENVTVPSPNTCVVKLFGDVVVLAFVVRIDVLRRIETLYG
jgi:hypothetical protein